MKISAWNCISCGNVVMSRYVDPDLVCIICKAFTFSQNHIKTQMQMMHGGSDPRNN
jgi:hypothetical protein